MPRKNADLERLREVVAPVCLAHGLSLVDARFVTQRGAVLRVMIERPGLPPGQSGVTLADCQAVSRDLSTALDVEDEVVPKGAYRLEVSSPGVERPLITREDFLRFAGQEIRLQTIRPHDGRRRFHGVLRGLQGDTVQIDSIDAPGAVHTLPFDDVVKAHLVYRF